MAQRSGRLVNERRLSARPAEEPTQGSRRECARKEKNKGRVGRVCRAEPSAERGGARVGGRLTPHYGPPTCPTLCDKGADTTKPPGLDPALPFPASHRTPSYRCTPIRRAPTSEPTRSRPSSPLRTHTFINRSETNPLRPRSRGPRTPARPPPSLLSRLTTANVAAAR